MLFLFIISSLFLPHPVVATLANFTLNKVSRNRDKVSRIRWIEITTSKPYSVGIYWYKGAGHLPYTREMELLCKIVSVD